MKNELLSQRNRPLLVLIGLFALTSLALAFSVDPDTSLEAGINMVLPDQVGAWTGEELRFCQNKQCRKSFVVNQLEDRDVCPDCESELREATIAELDLLPDDTGLLKKRYVHTSGRVVQVAIVLSGAERASIHRPEICLRGQGNTIGIGETIQVPMEQRKPLDVMVLPLTHTRKNPEGEVIYQGFSYYAYWFVGKGRETASHHMRMFYMAADRIFKNVAHRWAYISVSGGRASETEEYQDDLKLFIKDLYPHMTRS